jgi:GDP-mannose 4,6 dehydratase
VNERGRARNKAFQKDGLFRIRMISPSFLLVFWATATAVTVIHRLLLCSVLQRIRLKGRNLRNAAADALGLKIACRGHGADEKAFNERGQCVVDVDSHYFRPAEVETLVGDASKARAKLNWEPKVSFRELFTEMVAADFKTCRA